MNRGDLSQTMDSNPPNQIVRYGPIVGVFKFFFLTSALSLWFLHRAAQDGHQIHTNLVDRPKQGPNLLINVIPFSGAATLLKELKTHWSTAARKRTNWSFREVPKSHIADSGDKLSAWLQNSGGPNTIVYGNVFHINLGRQEKWLAMVADPITQFKGHYFRSQWRQMGNYTLREVSGALKLDLEASLDSYIEEGQCQSGNRTTTRYFCGYDPKCGALGSPWALERALANIQAHYPVVGVYERPNETLTAWRSAHPSVFSEFEWDPPENEFNGIMEGIRLSSASMGKLKHCLAVEFQLYSFLLQRLLPTPESSGNQVTSETEE